MSENIGYLFYRCAYRSEDGLALRETDTLDNTVINSVTEVRPTSTELAGSIFPYQPRYIPKPEMHAEESPVSQQNDMYAALLARFGSPHDRQARNPQSEMNNDETREYDRKLIRADKEAKEINNVFSFDLTIQYPGLYAGLGYAHGLSGSNDDVKTGFSFDYTTGLPYIPGSSLKGTLRSCFINHAEDIAAELPELSKSEIEAMETQLFGPRNGKEGACGCLTCYDVFPKLMKQGQALMAFDNITPHLDPLAPPNPIKTLRLRPGVSLRFLFSLPDDFSFVAESGQTIQRNKIIVLFKTLLIDWGIGAKTNVGYGNMTT